MQRDLHSITIGLIVTAILIEAIAVAALAEQTGATDAPPAATVLGESINTDNVDEMQQIILSRLLADYATQQGITATDAELAAYIDRMQQGLQSEGLDAMAELNEEERAEAEAIQRDIARSLIGQWKINRQLYRDYGGRVIYQQLGPEPLDAYLEYLQERQRAGDFVIFRDDFEEAFWRYFTDDTMHDFFKPGTEAGAFERPPWQ